MERDTKLSPLLRLALKSGAVEAITAHLHRGESPNGRDPAGLTPLMIAAVHNQQECCLRLLDLGADASLISTGGKTARELAFDHGHLTLAAMLSRDPSPSAEVTVCASPMPRDATSASPSAEPHGNDVIELAAGGADNTSTAVGVIASPAELAPLVALSGEGVSESPLDGWFADEHSSTPVHDESCVADARQAQLRISNHRRVSDDTDWSNTEFELPAAAFAATVIVHDLNAIACVLASGLQEGYVSADDLHRALHADCAFYMDRANEVLHRALDDLGILIEADGASILLAEPCAKNDELDELLPDLYDNLAGPLDLSTVYAREARKHDLIKREDEESLGRRMDSALGALTRALAALPEPEWLLFFPKVVSSWSLRQQDLDDTCENEDESPVAELGEANGEADGHKIEFPDYVARVRDGAPENGRDATVPRPGAWELSRYIDVARNVDETASIAVRSSITMYETARDRLVTANLRLAISLAHGYRNRGLPLEDLIQDANIGLMRAAEGYDFRRGFKFSTYATWWIRQAVSRGVADSARMIRVPVHQVEKINAVNRTRRELEYGRERAVCTEEIANRLGLSAEQIRRAIRSDIEVVSLEECGSEREPYTPDAMDIVDSFQDPMKASCDRSLKNALKGMLEELDKRSRDVLMARFGFDGADDKTLEEVGRQFNVTRERIRQIEAKALRKFRHPSRHDVLAPYLNIPPRITELQEEE